MQHAGRIVKNLVEAAIILFVANVLFYTPSCIRWQLNQPAVIKEIETRNKFWYVASVGYSDVPLPPDKAKERHSREMLTQDDANTPWHRLAELISARDERALILDPLHVGKVQFEYNGLKPDTFAREGDGLDWAVKWHNVFAGTAAYDYRGKLVAQRGSWCVMGRRFTRTFAYELALAAEYVPTAVELPTSQKPPVTPLFVIYDQSVVPLFPVSGQPVTWLAALIELVMIAGGLFYLKALVRLPEQQRQEARTKEQPERTAQQKRITPPTTHPLTAAVLSTPGPLQSELDQLLALERQLAGASMGYGQDLPELVRVRSLIQQVKRANANGKVRDRAEPGSPAAPVLEKASDIMDIVEARLDMEPRRPPS